MKRTVRRSFGRDQAGVSTIEFAILAPVLCLLLVGAFDMAHSLYMTAVLQGVVQKTARDSALETNTSTTTAAAIDDRVRRQVKALANNATVTFDRRYYRTFEDARTAKPETWSDGNGNGRCDAGENYQDANANLTWDADGGNAGQGGAQDRTVYTVTVSYTRLLPVSGFLGFSPTQSIIAKTVLQNQPYAEQAKYSSTVVTRSCP